MSDSGVGSREPGVGAETPSIDSSSDSRTPNGDSRDFNWPLLYSAVLAELAILVIIFYAFTRAFA